MDDKQFDEKMGKYVESTANERSEDLKKFCSCEKKTTRRSYYFNVILASVSVFILIAATIGIFFIFSPTQTADNIIPDSSNAYPFSDSTISSANSGEIAYDYFYDVDLIKFDSFEESNQVFSSGYLTPKDEFSPIEMHLYKAKEIELYLGVKLDYQSLSYYYDYLVFSATINKYSSQFINGYDLCEDTSTWNDIELKYNKAYNDDDELYTVKIIFTSGDYDYYMTATMYEDFTPQEILDFLL